METAQPIKRPVGMTILLVLSFINACLQIFSALGMLITAPVMSQMLENGDLEKMMAPFISTMQLEGEDLDLFWQTIELRLSISPAYYLLTALFFIGSLVGVIKMFKLQRLGFHIYSIAQMLILIIDVVFIYSKQPNNSFFSTFLTTVFLILIYHLYLKRIEFLRNLPNPNNNEDTQGE